MRFYHFANWALRIIFRVLLRYEIRGLEKVPPEGALVVCINHTNFLDPLMVGAFVPRDVVMMSKTENFRIPLLGLITRLYGAFPVNRGEVDRRALKKAIGVLREGKALLMAPEGTRSKTLQMQKAYQGVAVLIQETDAPVLPVGMYGGHRFWHNLLRLRRTPVVMAIGEPFMVRSPPGLSRKVARECITDAIMYRIAALIPSQYRGIYGDVGKPTQLKREVRE